MSFRISTQQYYKRNTDLINTAYSRLLTKQDQIASGKKVQTPSDDPVAAARINLLNERLSRTERYAKNATSALDTLSIHEGNLNTMNNIFTKLKELHIQGGNGSYSAADRQALSNEVEHMLDQMVSMANTKDASGRYIYGGSQSASIPITQSGTTFNYNGDDGQRTANITSGLKIATSNSGYDLFMNIGNSNGDFSTSGSFNSATSSDSEYPFRNIGFSDHTNTGSKTISSTNINDRDLYERNIDTYFIEFDTTGASTTYDVYDSDGQSVVSGAEFTEGEPIQFNGIEVTFDTANVLGNGDIFKLSPKPKESIFETVQSIISHLGRSGTTDAEKLLINEEHSALSHQMDKILEHLTNNQASAGSRQQSILLAQETNDEMIFSSKSTIALLEDVDIAEAAIELNGISISLQAAQQSFAKIQELSLFNYI